MPSLPSAFTDQMKSRLGKDFNAFEKSLQTTVPVSIRLNRNKTDLQPALKPVPWAEAAYYLAERPLFTADPLFHAGLYYPQEASSMFLEQAFKAVIDHTENIKVLDLCAAPGGKSTHLSSLMGANDILVSNEVIRQRAHILAENISKWGRGNVIVTNNDPADFKNLNEAFDLIVVDAPCSGEGMFRKDEDAIKEWSPANVNLCSERQQRILAEILPALKPGGSLIYSTCTYNEQENEQNMRWLRSLGDMESVRVETQAGWGIEEIYKEEIYAYRFYPHKLAGEGLFMAVLRKPESGSTGRHRYKNQKSIIESLPSKNKNILSSWILNGTDYNYWHKQGTAFAASFYDSSFLPVLAERLYVVYAGVELAEIKGQDYIPLQGLANSIHFNREIFPEIDLQGKDALMYLSKADFKIDSSEKGFCCMTYQGFPLGWIKHLGNRSNNLYPKEWRIRMDVGKVEIPALLI